MNLIKIRNYHKFHLRKSLSYNTIVNAKPPRRFEFHHHFYCVIFYSLIFCCKDISRKYIPGIDIQSSTGLVPFDLGIFIFYGQHISITYRRSAYTCKTKLKTNYLVCFLSKMDALSSI